MTKLILLTFCYLSLTACSLGFLHPNPPSWQTIQGDLKPINPDMVTHRRMNPIKN